MEFQSIAHIVKDTFNPQETLEGRPCIELEHIQKESGRLMGCVNSRKQLSIKNVFTKDDVLFGKLRPNLRKFVYCDFDGVCSTEIWVLRASESTHPTFLFYLVQQDRFINAACMTSGTKMPRADWGVIADIPFLLPPLAEQKAIAQILSTWDDAIEKTQLLISAKEKQKRSLMQKLLTGKHRFRGFIKPWRMATLGDYCICIRGVTYKPQDLLAACADEAIVIFRANNIQNSTLLVTHSHLLAKKNVRSSQILENNDILICMSNGSEHLVGKSALVIDPNVNWSYGAFMSCVRTLKCEELHPGFLHATLLSNEFTKYMKILFTGDGIIKNLRNSDINLFCFKLPKYSEQLAIVNILSMTNNEINHYMRILEHYEAQKRGLMQKLLTGEWRVNPQNDKSNINE